jgi:hypothetical protein
MDTKKLLVYDLTTKGLDQNEMKVLRILNFQMKKATNFTKIEKSFRKRKN